MFISFPGKTLQGARLANYFIRTALPSRNGKTFLCAFGRTCKCCSCTAVVASRWRQRQHQAQQQLALLRSRVRQSFTALDVSDSNAGCRQVFVVNVWLR